MNSGIHAQMLEEIRRDIASLEKQIEELKAAERYHAGKTNQTAVVEERQANNGEVDGTKVDVKNMKIWVVARKILREAGKPMTALQIGEEMVRRGYNKNKNKKSLRNTVFSSMHNRDDVFEKTAPGVWSLKQGAKEDTGKNE